MKRMVAVTVAAAFGMLAACAEEVRESWYAEKCRAAIGKAKTNEVWRWQRNAHVDAGDAVFQQELRTASEARLPKEAQGETQRQWAMRNGFPNAVRETETMRAVSKASAEAGYTRQLQLDFGEVALTNDAAGAQAFDAAIRTSGRVTNVTDVLRYSLRQLRAMGRRADVLSKNIPASWYEGGDKDAPVFQSRCLIVNDEYRFFCSYQMRSEGECWWEGRTRPLGKERTMAGVDVAPVWKLMARRPSDYSFEDVLKVFGRPLQSATLGCRHCGRTSMSWTYEILDRDYFGSTIVNTLVFSFEADGRCAGWKWCAVPQSRDSLLSGKKRR